MEDDVECTGSKGKEVFILKMEAETLISIWWDSRIKGKCDDSVVHYFELISYYQEKICSIKETKK